MALQRLTSDDETFLESFIAEQKILWDRIKGENYRLTESENRSTDGLPTRNNHDRDSLYPLISPNDDVKPEWRSTDHDRMNNKTWDVGQQVSGNPEELQNDNIRFLSYDEVTSSNENKPLHLNDYSNHPEHQGRMYSERWDIPQQRIENTEELPNDEKRPYRLSHESLRPRIDEEISSDDNNSLNAKNYSNREERPVSRGEISPGLLYSVIPSITSSDVENGRGHPVRCMICNSRQYVDVNAVNLFCSKCKCITPL